jgi:hypothetical protein
MHRRLATAVALAASIGLVAGAVGAIATSDRRSAPRRVDFRAGNHSIARARPVVVPLPSQSEQSGKTNHQ